MTGRSGNTLRDDLTVDGGRGAAKVAPLSGSGGERTIATVSTFNIRIPGGFRLDDRGIAGDKSLSVRIHRHLETHGKKTLPMQSGIIHIGNRDPTGVSVIVRRVGDNDGEHGRRFGCSVLIGESHILTIHLVDGGHLRILHLIGFAGKQANKRSSKS